MSVKKYKTAREFREGVAARILAKGVGTNKSEDFREGYNWAGDHLFDDIYDYLNEYLISKGEEEILLVEVMRNAKK